MPETLEKINIFLIALKLLTQNNNNNNKYYEYIGLDHFAKSSDELAIAKKQKTLGRNFQGYTSKNNLELFSLGNTAISNFSSLYCQNEKNLLKYIKYFLNNKFINIPPVTRGKLITQEDFLRRNIINKILCQGEIEIKNLNNFFVQEIQELKVFETEGLIEFKNLDNNSCNYFSVTPEGYLFLRNIASVFDSYFNNSNNLNNLSYSSKKIFSNSV